LAALILAATVVVMAAAVAVAINSWERLRIFHAPFQPFLAQKAHRTCVLDS
jgi:hypothetical protein